MNHDGKVLLLRLYEKTSATGNRYFAGRLGAAKVAMFLDKRADGADPVWEVFVQGGDPDGKPATAPGRDLLGAAPPQARRPRGPRKEMSPEAVVAHAWQIPDDPL